MLTQERLKELFDYRDGSLFWRKTGGGRNKDCHAGCIANNGYVHIKIDGTAYLEHRLVWLWHHGYFPENQVDHINRDRAKNGIENLREVSNVCNLRNTGSPKNNTSGVKGVMWSKRNKKWRSGIVINDKHKFLGLSSDFTEAVAQRLAGEQFEDWDGCDSSSPAYQYMQEYLKKCQK
jgi:hypothetical protein